MALLNSLTDMYGLGLLILTVAIQALFTQISAEEQKRRLGSALNVGQWWHPRPHADKRFEGINELEIPSEADVFEPADKRRIGAALNRLSYRYSAPEVADKRRLGAAKNVRYGSWYYKPEEKRRIGAALNQGYKNYPTYYTEGKRGIGTALNAIRQDLWSNRGSGKRLMLHANDDWVSSIKSSGKRRLGSALNTKYKTWMYNSARQRRGADDTFETDSEATGQEEAAKRRIGSALNVKYAMMKKQVGEPDNLAGNGITYPGKLPRGDLNVDSGADDKAESDTADKEGESGPEKRRFGAAMNSMRNAIKPSGKRDGEAEVVNTDISNTVSDDTQKRRIGAALNVRRKYKTYNDDNEKRRLGSALNVNFKTLQQPNKGKTDKNDIDKRRIGSALNAFYKPSHYVHATDKKDATDLDTENLTKRRIGAALNAGQYRSSYSQGKRDSNDLDTDDLSKRRIGAALNAGRYRTSYSQGKRDSSDLDFDKRRLGSALNSKYKSYFYTQPHDEEKRRLGSALNALAGQHVPAYQTASHNEDKRRLGSALNAKYQSWYSSSPGSSADKRRLGAALSAGSNHLPGSAVRPAWSESDFDADKRRIGSALNVKHHGWQYKDGRENQLAEEKRRIGAALNARYYGSIGRSKRSTSLQEEMPGSHALTNRAKKFLGAALNVRYRKFGSPFLSASQFRSGSGWAHQRVKRSSTGTGSESIEPVGERPEVEQEEKRRIGAARNAWRPKYQSQVTKLAPADAKSSMESIKQSGLQDAKHKFDVNTKTNHGNSMAQVDKRHLGSLIKVGSPFPMTKYSPSRYLRKISPSQDMAKYYARQIGQEMPTNDMSKAQMYKFYG